MDVYTVWCVGVVLTMFGLPILVVDLAERLTDRRNRP
jgi:hypothetical protein